MADTQNVFSLAPYPFAVSYSTDKNKRVRKVQTLYPGTQKVNKEIWEKIKDNKALQARMDSGQIRTTKVLSVYEKEKLVVDSHLEQIRMLTPGAKEIPTGEIEPGSGQFYTIEEQRKRGLI